MSLVWKFQEKSRLLPLVYWICPKIIVFFYVKFLGELRRHQTLDKHVEHVLPKAEEFEN